MGGQETSGQDEVEGVEAQMNATKKTVLKGQKYSHG